MPSGTRNDVYKILQSPSGTRNDVCKVLQSPPGTRNGVYKVLQRASVSRNGVCKVLQSPSGTRNGVCKVLQSPPVSRNGVYNVIMSGKRRRRLKSKNLAFIFHNVLGFVRSRFFDFVRFTHYAQNDRLYALFFCVKKFGKCRRKVGTWFTGLWKRRQ